MGTLQTQNEGRPAKTRMMNLELLRCIAMMMVVALHFLGKGGLLGDLSQKNLGVTEMVAWALESFCIVAVNVYMLISGYFLCQSGFKLSRLFQLLMQIWFYSVVFGLLGAVFGMVPAETVDLYYFLQLIFPVSMNHYWFMTAYVFFYLLLPLVGAAVKQLSKKQLQFAIGALFFWFCLFKSVLPIRLTTDGKGYDFLWYLCVFLVAAYFRRFGMGALEKKSRGFLLYFVACLLAFGEIMLLYMLYSQTGKLLGLLTVSHEYNHVLPFLASVGLFSAFLGIRVPEGIGRIFGKIASLTLGVYLMHENLGVRYAWQRLFGADAIQSVGGLFIGLFVAIFCVFAAGILVEAIRSALMKGLHVLLLRVALYRHLVEKITAVDRLFLEKKEAEQNK